MRVSSPPAASSLARSWPPPAPNCQFQLSPPVQVSSLPLTLPPPPSLPPAPSWHTASALLSILSSLAALPSPPTATQLADLDAHSARLSAHTAAFRRSAVAQFALVAAMIVCILLLNLGSAVLCGLMQGRIERAEARLVGGGWAGGAGSGGRGRLSKRELERMARPKEEEVQEDGAGQGERPDETVKERAETVLAMKKALFDLRVVTTVVGFNGTVDLAFVVYIIIYSANGWLVSRSFS